MSLYYIVQDNTIIDGPTLLPAPLQLTSPEELVNIGWYPVIQNMPDTFKERIEVLSDPILEIGEGIVTATYTKRDKTEEEMHATITAEWEPLRTERNHLLKETDYITMADRWSTLTDEEKTAWATYRQALRDIPQTFENIWVVQFPEKV
jgi:hypothetical protein